MRMQIKTSSWYTDGYAYSAPRSFMIRRTSCPSSSLTGACCSAARAARIPAASPEERIVCWVRIAACARKFRAKASARYQKILNVLYHKANGTEFQKRDFRRRQRIPALRNTAFCRERLSDNWTGKMHREIFCGTKDRERLQHIPYRCCGFPAHRPWARFLQYRRFQSPSCIFDKSRS